MLSEILIIVALILMNGIFSGAEIAIVAVRGSRIEELIATLREQVTIIIVTHNMQQAARVSDYTAFMYLGELIETSGTRKMFENPSHKLTEEYITGHFG